MEHENASQVSGSNLKVWDGEQITDASPVREKIINTQDTSGIILDIISDKCCDVTVTPLLSLDEDTSVGKTFSLGTVIGGGGPIRMSRFAIVSPRLKITLTKTEAGDTASYLLSVRGIVIPEGMVDPLGNQLLFKDGALSAKSVDGAGRASANSVFGDSIVGTRVPTIAAQFQYGIRVDDVVADIVTTGTTVIEDSMLKLNTGVAADGHIGIQGSDYVRYIPGHEAYAFFTSVFSAPAVGLTQRVGLFDYDGGNGNGFFIGYNGTDFGVTRRRAGVDTFTSVDLSTVFPCETFDPEKGNVYKISYGYLGFAAITFEVMTPAGFFATLAKILYPNSSTETHIANTNIPLRAEMTNSGSTVDSQMRIGSVSAGIVDGGGADPIARVFSFALPTVVLVAGEVNQIAHFRNKDTFFGITNKISSHLILISAATEGNKTVAFGIKKNATVITPGTWDDADADSIMEYSTDTIVDIDTGVGMIRWNMAKSDTFFQDIEKFLVKLRPGEWATFFSISTSASDVDLSIRWKDLF